MTNNRFLVPPPIEERLIPGRDIDIIACQRRDPKALHLGLRVNGVRWTTRPDLGARFPFFPYSGYVVSRRVGGTDEPLNGGAPFFPPLSEDWPTFAAEADVRRPLLGPWFPQIVEEELGFLLPLLRLTDPRISNPSLEKRVLEVAAFLNSPHENDPELALKHWPNGIIPPLADLLSNSATAADVFKFYYNSAVVFLLGLALRFEYAVLLGLATDDFVKEDFGDVTYIVSANWEVASGVAESEPVANQQFCDPGMPTGFAAETHPGYVRYPHVSVFDGWSFPNALRPDGYDDIDDGRVLFSPRSPAHFTELKWDPPVRKPKLLDHSAVLFDIGRFDHGSSTVTHPAVPTIPSTATFKEIEPGELFQTPPEDLGILDRPGMDWPPLLGWYSYRLWGVDLLGVRSSTPAETSVLHMDHLAPPPPGIAMVSERTLELPDGDTSVNIELDLTWEAEQDFDGPDTTEFRVATSWIGRVSVPVLLLSVTEATKPGQISVTLDSLPGPADRYAGTQLNTADGSYVIVSAQPGTPGQLIVRRSGGRVPAIGQDGAIVIAAEATPITRVAKIQRAPAVPVDIVNVAQVQPIRIELNALSGAMPTGSKAHVYLHLLRSSFVASRTSMNVWELEEPSSPDDPRRDALAQWRALGNAAELLNGSPAVLYPMHRISFDATVPTGFVAGILQASITAADNADYVESPQLASSENPDLEDLRGNESEASVLVVSVRSLRPPDKPDISYDPNRIIWAEGASLYVEEASYQLSWPAVPGATRYEVWRALEGSLLPPNILPRQVSDSDLRLLGDQKPEAFDLRSQHVFTPRYTDLIPGRAPTRALYRIRAITEAGVVGAFSALFGPVRVPDIRRPLAPNLVSVGPPRALPAADEDAAESDVTFGPGSTNDPSVGTEIKPVLSTNAVPRTVSVVWTQAGDVEGLRFQIELKNGDNTWEAVAATNVNPVPLAGGPPDRFSLALSNRTAGKPHELRVRAVRVALDPIDPTGATTREIVGAPSSTMIGRAVGELRAPRLLQAIYDPSAEELLLVWENNDQYEELDIGRRHADQFRFEWVRTVPGDSAVAVIPEVLEPGLWSFRLRARGFSRKSFGEAIQVHVP